MICRAVSTGPEQAKASAQGFDKVSGYASFDLQSSAHFSEIPCHTSSVYLRLGGVLTSKVPFIRAGASIGWACREPHLAHTYLVLPVRIFVVG